MRRITLDEFKRIEEMLSNLTRKLDNIGLVEPSTPYCSPETDKLDAALAKAQGAMDRVSLNKENPYFKKRYADLKIITDTATPALSVNGLSIRQHIILNTDGSSTLVTRLCHESGQWAESRMKIAPAKNDIQTLGSYVAYLKRLSYASLICLVTPDEDDDGEIAMSDAREILAKVPSDKYDPKKESFDTITKEQLDELEYELIDIPDYVDEILDKMRLRSLADLPKSQFMISIKRIREIKAKRSGLK
jgi:hypothetical protein